MYVNVDLSFVPDYLIPIITYSIDIKPYFVKNYIKNGNQENSAKISIYEYSGSLEDFQALLTSILEKNYINEYIVAQDTEAENTLAILKDGDIEQLGVLVCDFCGAVFHHPDEKYIHQKAHYLF
jgi:hypothetical protein